MDGNINFKNVSKNLIDQEGPEGLGWEGKYNIKEDAKLRR